MYEDFYTYQIRLRELLRNRACFPQESENFATGGGLVKKYDEQGHAKPFYGDTTVFPLPKAAQEELYDVQQALYAEGGRLLSEPLPKETFHLTLHDLCAGETPQAVEADVTRHKTELAPVLSAIRADRRIRLRSVGIVSMVASSLVMLFEPVSICDHDTVQRMYGAVDQLSPLSYPLTLHCTLVYYRPGTYRPEEWNGLMKAVTELNKRGPISTELTCDDLEYQYFRSMRDYENIDPEH